MQNRSGIERNVAAATLCAGLLVVTSVQAQDDAEVTEIIVTGSRIKQNEFDAPTPTVAISVDAIERSGATNLTDFLRTVPSLVGSEGDLENTGSQGYIGSTGLNLLNLRNLGTERTLVLVDGRRHVSQLPETAAVDINTIPIDLIERTDIVTGGVSAVYGADAVSGVVNFVMKKNFEGLVSRVQYGRAEAGKPTDVFASVTGGLNFADGRGNISGSVQHTDRQRLRARDRKFLRNPNYATMKSNPDDMDDDPSVPDQVPLKDVRYFDSARAGAIDVDFDYAPDLMPDGNPFQIPRYVPSFYSQGGSGTPLADYIGDVLPDQQNTVASVFANFSVSSAVNFFGEAKFVHGKATADGQPTFDFQLFQTAENPFIPASVAAQIIPGAAADGLGDPTAPDGLFMSRDNFDLGVRGEDITRDTMRFVTGMNGDIWSRYNYEVSYTYGQSDIDEIALNNRYKDRFLAAVDVVTDPSTGQPTCRSNLNPSALPFQGSPSFDFSGPMSFTPGANSGCRPLNLYGEGVADRAAIDWVMFNNKTRSRLTQNVFNAFLAGPVPGIELPAGDIDTVIGVEWRRESSRTVTPREDQLGQTFGNVILPVDGAFDVKETFAEVRVPLLNHAPFAERLQLSGAVRLSDYSTIGSTTTWNTGLLWAPVNDVTFRGTVAESVRAPNISELFSPRGQTFQRIDDPCDERRLANGTSYRAANCAAILSALGLTNPAEFSDKGSVTPNGFSGGNPDLTEETARSYTFGAVFRPRFAPGLAVSVDYYDINIKKAISTATGQEVADNCVDQPTIDNVFCDSVTRRRVGSTGIPGTITEFIVQPENVASFRTRGIDFNVNYRLDPAHLGASADIGTFTFSLLGNRLDRLTTIPTLGADPIDQRTTANLETGLYAPKWQTTFDTTWEYRGLTVNYGYNYFSKTTRYTLLTLKGNPDQASAEDIYYDARATHDLSASYDFLSGYRVYAGVNNLTDQRPDVSIMYPVSPVGRFYYVGVKVSVGGT